MVRERRFLPAGTGKSAGRKRNVDAAEMPPPRNVLSEFCVSDSTGSTPAEQKRSRLFRDNIIAQLFRRAWFLSRLNEKTPPGKDRGGLAQSDAAFRSSEIFRFGSQLRQKKSRGDTADVARGRLGSPRSVLFPLDRSTPPGRKQSQLC